MGVKLTRKPDLKRFYIKNEVNRLMQRVVIDAIAEIKTRTQIEGKDADGRNFKDYSKPYRRFKDRKTKSVSKINLTLTGKMMQAIASTVQERGSKVVGRIFLNSSTEAIKVIGNMKHRKFFLLADRQVKEFRDAMLEILRKK